MSSNIARVLLSLGVLSPMTSSIAVAAPESDRCVELVKECFAYTDTERADCFRGVSSDPSCSSSRIAQLAQKRWNLAPNMTDSDTEGPAFLGPQLVDSQCLANFDSAWSSALVKGPISDSEYETMSENLSQCAKMPASEFILP